MLPCCPDPDKQQKIDGQMDSIILTATQILKGQKDSYEWNVESLLSVCSVLYFCCTALWSAMWVFFKCYMNKFWYWMVTATEHLNLAKIKSDLRLLRVVFLLPYPLSSEIRFMIRRSDIFLKNLLLIIQHSFLRHWWQAFLAQTPQNKSR